MFAAGARRRELLAQLLTNLLDNACRYGEGPIELTACSAEDTCRGQR